MEKESKGAEIQLTISWDVTEFATLTIVLKTISVLGYGLVVYSTFAINHFELFGLRQAYCSFLKRKNQEIAFQTNFPYNLVRHPMMTGFLIGFWSTPIMTWSYLLFCCAFTAYIFVGINLEEQGLSKCFKERINGVNFE